MEGTVLIGIDGADWPGLGAAMARGLTPALSAMAAAGAIGPLRTIPPHDGPATWTTIATGRLPEDHGVIGHEEAWAGGIRPVSRASWRAAAMWEVMAEAGIMTASVAWPGVVPGAVWAGRHIDAGFAEANGRDWRDWALPLRCAPADLRETLRDLRVHPADIDGAMLAPLVPGLATVDQERDASLTQIAVAMAQAASVQAAAAHLLVTAHGQALFIHHRWLGTIQAAFRARVSPFDGVVDGAWRFLDAMIGRLRALAGDDATVIVASPGRTGAAGILLATGPAVPRQSAIEGAGVLDLAPTMLALSGLQDPVLPGRRIAMLAPPPTRAVPTVAPAPPPEQDHALMEALSAQGYPPSPPPSGAWRAGQYGQLGIMLLPRAPAGALRAADAAAAIVPDDPLALGLRAFALLALGRPEELGLIADRLAAVAPDRPWGAIARGAFHALRGEAGEARAFLEEAAASDEAITRVRAGAAWLVLDRAIDAERAFAAALELEPDNADAGIGAAMAARLARRPRDAEAALRRVIASDPTHIVAWRELATLLRDLGRTHEAQEAEHLLRRLGS